MPNNWSKYKSNGQITEFSKKLANGYEASVKLFKSTDGLGWYLYLRNCSNVSEQLLGKIAEKGGSVCDTADLELREYFNQILRSI